MCYTEQEQSYPTEAIIREFLLPLRIHLRYCWLFSGTVSGYATGSDLLGEDGQLVQINRMRMSGKGCLLGEHIKQIHGFNGHFMRAFWLDIQGKLVCVDDIWEDIKLCHVRAQRLAFALSLWTKDPSLCSEAMNASGEAHKALFKICKEATEASGGRFHNLYAHYPLTVDPELEQFSSRVIEDGPNDLRVKTKELKDGAALLFALEPLYVAYFNFLSKPSCHEDLNLKVKLLGAEWLVEQDRFELQFTQNLRRSWLLRLLVKACMLLFLH